MDLAPGLFASGDAVGRRLLAGFERLVHLEEVLDLADQLRREIGEIVHVVPPRFLRWHAQDLGVLAGLVAHVQHTDGSCRDPHARKHRIFEQHQGVERVAVAAEGFGDVSVVGRIRRRGEQPSVEVDAARVVIDLVLVAAAARDLDHDVDAVVRQRAGGHVAMLAYPASVGRIAASSVSSSMEFRRITNLPPYVFTIINNLKIEARRAGVDVIDLGFGNPDIPSPQIAVDKLTEAAHIARNHRYSVSRGLPKLREAAVALYERNWGVQLDPELEITNTIGSKEGFSHLMWVLLDRGDAAIVPSPSYPIHIYGPLFAGADLRQVPMRHLADPRVQGDFTGDFFDNLTTAYDVGWPKPRVLVISFPHNPTGAVVDLDFMQQRGRLLSRARDDRRSRLRVRRRRLRRLPAPQHPPGRGGQGLRRRAVLDDQELLDGRMAVCVPGRQPIGRAGTREVEDAISTTARSSRSRLPRR